MKDNVKNYVEVVDFEFYIEFLIEFLYFDFRVFLLDKMSIKLNIEYNEF